MRRDAVKRGTDVDNKTPRIPAGSRIRCVLVLKRDQAVALADLLTVVRDESPELFKTSPLEEVFWLMHNEND